jgi:hypothetical protein
MNDHERDEYLDVAYEQWENIFWLYREFEEKHPVMLYDIQEQRIYAYPYEDYLKELSEKSRVMLREQYEEAMRENKIVVFIRDNEARRLVSYAFQYPDLERPARRRRKKEAT